MLFLKIEKKKRTFFSSSINHSINVCLLHTEFWKRETTYNEEKGWRKKIVLMEWIFCEIRMFTPLFHTTQFNMKQKYKMHISYHLWNCFLLFLLRGALFFISYVNEWRSFFFWFLVSTIASHSISFSCRFSLVTRELIIFRKFEMNTDYNSLSFADQMGIHMRLSIVHLIHFSLLQMMQYVNDGSDLELHLKNVPQKKRSKSKRTKYTIWIEKKTE